MANKIHLKMITPSREMYDGDADMVIVRTKSGDVGILYGHQPMITVLDYGVMRIVNGDNEEKVAVFGGFAEVGDDGLLIMSDVAEKPEEIQEERALAAKKRAEERLAATDSNESEIDVLRAELALKRATIRLGLKDMLK